MLSVRNTLMKTFIYVFNEKKPKIKESILTPLVLSAKFLTEKKRSNGGLYKHGVVHVWVHLEFGSFKAKWDSLPSSNEASFVVPV